MNSSRLVLNMALTPPFSLFHLPPLVPGTEGIGLPKPGTDAVVCIAPGHATTYNENWGKDLVLERGFPHAALAPDDHYPNQMFERDYGLAHAVSADDPRAMALAAFWHDHGYDNMALRSAWSEYLDSFDENRRPKWWADVRMQVEKGELFFLGKREQPVRVLGFLDLRLQTSEGPVIATHGSVLVVHPDDPTNTWLIDSEKFARRYNWVAMPSGLVAPR